MYNGSMSISTFKKKTRLYGIVLWAFGCKHVCYLEFAERAFFQTQKICVSVLEIYTYLCIIEITEIQYKRYKAKKKYFY